MILRAIGSPGDNAVKVLLKFLNEKEGGNDISWKKYFAALAIIGVNPGVEQAVDIVGSVSDRGGYALYSALDAFEKIGAPSLPNLVRILTTEREGFANRELRLKAWQIIANMNLNDVSPVVAHLDTNTLLHFLEPKSGLSSPFIYGVMMDGGDFLPDVSLESKTLFVKLFSKMGNDAVLALTGKVDRGAIGKAGVYILNNLENHEIVKRWRNQQELNAAQLRKDLPKREQDLIDAVHKVLILDEEYKSKKYQLNSMTPLANVSSEATKLKKWGEENMEPALRNLASLVKSFCADYGVRALYDLSIKGGFRDKVNDVLEISRTR